MNNPNVAVNSNEVEMIPFSEFVKQHPEIMLQMNKKSSGLRLLDIIESFFILLVAYSLSSNAFTQAGFIPRLLFSLAVTVVFMLLYHEKYIGIVLNIGISLLWTFLITLIISFFPPFDGRLWLLIALGIIILFLSLCIHGLNPFHIKRWLKNRTNKDRAQSINTSSEFFQKELEAFHTAYDEMDKIKDLAHSVACNALASGELSAEDTEFFNVCKAAIEGLPNLNAEVIRISGESKVTEEIVSRIHYYTGEIHRLIDFSKKFCNIQG